MNTIPTPEPAVKMADGAKDIWSMQPPSGKDVEQDTKAQELAAQTIGARRSPDIRQRRGGRRGNAQTITLMSGGPTGVAATKPKNPPESKNSPELRPVRESIVASATTAAGNAPSSTGATTTISSPTSTSSTPVVVNSTPPSAVQPPATVAKDKAETTGNALASSSNEPSPMEIDKIQEQIGKQPDKVTAIIAEKLIEIQNIDPAQLNRGEKILKLRKIVEEMKALSESTLGNDVRSQPFTLKMKEMESLLAPQIKAQMVKTQEQKEVVQPKIIDEKVADLDKKLSGLLDETIKFFLKVSEALNPKDKNVKPDFEALRASFKELEAKFPPMKTEGLALQKTALNKLKGLDQTIEYSKTAPYTEVNVASIVKDAHLEKTKVDKSLKDTTQKNIARIAQRDQLAIHWNHSCKTALEIEWQLALIKEALETLPEIKNLSWQLASLLENCTKFFEMPPRDYIVGKVEDLNARFRGVMPKVSDLSAVRESIVSGAATPQTVKAQFTKLKENVTTSKPNASKKKEALEALSLDANRIEKMTQLDLMKAIHTAHATSKKLVEEITDSYKKIHDHYNNLRNDLIKEWNKLCGALLLLEWQVECVEDCLDVVADVRNLSDLHAALSKEARDDRLVTNDKPSVEKQLTKYQPTYDRLSEQYLALKAKVEPKLAKLTAQQTEGADLKFVEAHMKKKELFEILDPATKTLVLQEVQKSFDLVQKQRDVINKSLKTFWDDLSQKSKEMVTELRMKVNFINRGEYPYKKLAGWKTAGANEIPYPMSPAEPGYEKPKKEEKQNTPTK